jgi:hypothetical protein
MPELVLQTLNKRAFQDLYRRAGQGDASAMGELDALWSQYQSLACFLCDGEISGTPFTLMLPEHRDRHTIIAAPLCQSCRGLPANTRLHRAIKILQQMYRDKSGKQVHFSFTPVHRH